MSLAPQGERPGVKRGPYGKTMLRRFQIADSRIAFRRGGWATFSRGYDSQASTWACSAHMHHSREARAFICALRKISIRSVVHTATPVPKKSLSAVHTPQANASADASTGQSLSSRPRNRGRASSSKTPYNPRSTGSITFRRYLKTGGRSVCGFPCFFNSCGKCLRASSKTMSGAKNRTAWLV